MADYINREDALKLCRDGKLLSSNAFEKLAIKYIADIPSADVRPVKHGKLETEICDDGFGAYNLFVCSLCGSESAKRFNYCRECGAKMDGET